MKIEEAIRKMKPGDVFKHSESTFTASLNEYGVLINDGIDAPVTLTIANLELDGEIIPEKDEPMSAEEWMIHKYGENAPGKQYTYIEMCLSHDAGAAENEKKHRATQAEIKDEPMRAEEWAEQNYKNFDCLHDYIDYATRAFKAGASENEKKYRAQYTCKDAWWDKWQSMPDNAFKHGWNECLKSHNLPEEN